MTDYDKKTTCNDCGEQFSSETYMLFRHMRTKHPERWEHILKEVEQERRK